MLESCTFQRSVIPQRKISNDPERAKISELAVVWFYDEAHMELQINKSCYSLYLGKVQNRRKMALFVERANSSVGSPFVRFVLRADEVSIKALQARLKAPQPDVPFEFCCTVVANLIDEYVNVRVPFLDRCTPSGVSYFLAAQSKAQNSPIANIEHFGPSAKASVIAHLKNGEGKRSGILFDLMIGALLSSKVFGCNCCEDVSDDNV